MTGAYLRVKRNEKWTNIEVEYLTNEERKEMFQTRKKDELVRWFNLVCNALVDLEKAIAESNYDMKEK